MPELQSQVRDRRANWKQSLVVLREAKAAGVQITKTSIMLGLVGCCRLTVSKPVLKAPMVSALEATI